MKHLLKISAVYLIGNPKRVTCGHPYLRILFPFVPQVHANFEFPRIDKMESTKILKPSPFQTLCFFSKRGARCPDPRLFWNYIDPKMTKSTRFERGRFSEILQTPFYPIWGTQMVDVSSSYLSVKQTSKKKAHCEIEPHQNSCQYPLINYPWLLSSLFGIIFPISSSNLIRSRFNFVLY